MSSDERPSVLRPGPLPRHIGIIMDGNGRWAEERGLPRFEGHRRGADSVRDVVTAAREANIEALTLYAFSAQNWERPEEEVAGLMGLLFDFLDRDKPTLMNNRIRLETIGEVHRLPGFVRERLELVRAETSANDKMVLTLALSYGSREEITSAVQRIARRVATQELSPENIDQTTIDAALDTAKLPPLDFVIRTSGEVRLSNFLLWQAAYAELLFVDFAWPDFGRAQLYDAIEVYRGRKRRFGKTDSQIAAEANAC